jgi:hypothetical protein
VQGRDRAAIADGEHCTREEGSGLYRSIMRDSVQCRGLFSRASAFRDCVA